MSQFKDLNHMVEGQLLKCDCIHSKLVALQKFKDDHRLKDEEIDFINTKEDQLLEGILIS